MKINKRNLTVAKLPRSVKRLFPNIKECYDSDRPVDVDVSNIDVRDSKPLDPTECAVAKAFKREMHVDAAIIGISSSYLIQGKTAIRFHTPTSVRTELISFDRHGSFEPGHYYLIPQTRNHQLGARKSGSEKKETTDHSPKRKIHRTAKVRVLDSGYE